MGQRIGGLHIHAPLVPLSGRWPPGICNFRLRIDDRARSFMAAQYPADIPRDFGEV
jgi:hypothetical protein